jgi:uncharacterized protein (DUF1501 family)
MNRRTFLTNSLAAMGGSRILGAGLGTLGLQALAGASDSGNGRTLVVIELRGGNDGLSTLIPYGDDEYYRARTSTAWRPKDVLKIDEYRGLHPKLASFSKLYGKGQLAVFQGVGYPNSNRSHFKSREIWHTADLRGRAGNDGWLGRFCEHQYPDSSLPELSVHIGKEVPYSLHSPTHSPVIFTSPDTYRWLGDEDAQGSLEASGKGSKRSTLDRLRGVMADAKGSSGRIRAALNDYETPVEYPSHESSKTMRAAAALIDVGVGSRIISATFGGFDTHANQKFDHSNSLGILDRALGSFIEDLGRSEAGRNTLVLVTSEFGRRVKENASKGTDHGKASVAFALGVPVKGGLFGAYPSLTSLDEQDLRQNVDFRSIYSSAIRWMGGDPQAVLGEAFAPLPFV